MKIFPNLYSEAMNVGTATTATTITTTTTTTAATMMTTISSTTTLQHLFYSTSTSVCIQTTHTFPLQCPMVLRIEVVLLKIQVCWNVLSY